MSYSRYVISQPAISLKTLRAGNGGHMNYEKEHF